MKFSAVKSPLLLILLGHIAACATISGRVSESDQNHPPRLKGYLEQPLIEPAQVRHSEDLMYQFLLAEIAMQNGQYSTSIENLLAVANKVGDPRVAERAARIAIYTKDYQSGLKALIRWVELEPDNLGAHQMAAILFIRSEDFTKAYQHLENILALSGEEGFMIIANVLAGEKDYEQALAMMKQLSEAHKSNPYALYAYGSLAAQFEHFESAKHLMSAAVVLKPDMVDAITAKARVMSKLGETDAAIKDLTKASRRNPNILELKITLGRMLISAKRYDDATTVFQEILLDSPNDDEIIYTLALLTLDLERYQEARKYFNELLILNRRTNESHYYLGRILESKQQYRNAIKYYSRVINSNYRLDAQLRIGAMFGKLDQVEEARSHIQALRGMYQETGIIVRTFLLEAEIFRDSRNYQQAYDVLTEGLNAFSENKELLYSRSLVAEKLDKLDQLEEDLRLILSKEPDNADALNALGYTLADRTDRIEEAYTLIDQAMKLKPDDPAVTDSYGWVLYRMGRYDEAVVQLRRALSLQYDAEIAAHLGEVLWVSGDQNAANQVWQQALDKIPQHEVLLKVMRRFKE